MDTSEPDNQPKADNPHLRIIRLLVWSTTIDALRDHFYLPAWACCLPGHLEVSPGSCRQFLVSDHLLRKDGWWGLLCYINTPICPWQSPCEKAAWLVWMQDGLHDLFLCLVGISAVVRVRHGVAFLSLLSTRRHRAGGDGLSFPLIAPGPMLSCR